MTRLRGDGLLARVMRSSVWTALGYGASQALRLVSNLILTRLLFPEAFGLMALVSVFIVGLTMFSDMGTHPAILQHRRGDDPAFLNTAFSIQVTRGMVLWIASAAIAWPAALFYDQPELAWLLPVAGFSLLLHGMEPTRVDTAARHLRLGRLTALDLISQAVGIASMVVLAWATQSVWALVAGWIVTSGTRLALVTLALPGPKSRLGWEPAAARDLMRFGFWLFLSTACGFLVLQGDKAILGKYLTLEQLGLYNIGFFLASFPTLLGHTIGGRILIPLYRERPPGESVANFARLRLMRFALTASVFALLAIMAFGGEWIVDFLYDRRYATAGAILVLIAVVQIPSVIGMTYDHAALAAGDSRNYFLLTAMRALFLVAGLIVGAEWLGLVGALLGQALAAIAVYPFLIWLARRHKAWDWLHDAVFAAIGLLIALVAIGLDRGAIAELLTLFAERAA
ncbi:MAG: oligosaccharide flippase family protein [Paracoccaceae bacterium]